MTIISAVIALVLVAIVAVVGWRVFFGVANPPLPSVTVSVQPSSAVASITSPSASTSSGPGADQLSIDGATFSVEIASTTLEQTRGLSYRPSLGADNGMLFIFSRGSMQSFWMKDMHFPLDMIWIIGDTVAGFAQNVPAPASGTALWNLPLYTSPDNVDKVLEVNAGTVAKYGIQIGDVMKIGPTE